MGRTYAGHCIAAVGIWEFFKRAVAWMLGIKEETAKERRLRRLREVARTAAQEELDREYLKREIEVEAETLRWPLKATASDPSSCETTGYDENVRDADAALSGTSTKS